MSINTVLYHTSYINKYRISNPVSNIKVHLSLWLVMSFAYDLGPKECSGPEHLDLCGAQPWDV